MIFRLIAGADKMTYKPILIPSSKQQRITIPKELGLEPGKEIVILFLFLCIMI